MSRSGGRNISGKKKKGREKPALLLFDSRIKTLREDRVINEVYSISGGKGCYLVGGVLRSLALARPPGVDYDFVVAWDGVGIKEGAEGVAERLGGTAFILDKDAPSYRVSFKSGGIRATVDFSPLKGKDITEDLLVRDFTVNAMAIELAALFADEMPLLIDPAKGEIDAKRRLLKATSPEVFREDPLRCLRAVRISRQYGLKITKGTDHAIKKESRLLSDVSPERVRDELLQIFASPNTSSALKSLYELKIMDAVLPEFVDWIDIGGGYDLLDHTLKTVDEAEALSSAALEGGFPEAGEGLRAHFRKTVGTVERQALFKMAAFLHDAGKPQTIGIRSGRLRFIGHEYEGSVRVEEILKRLKTSRKVTALLTALVKNHHRVFSLAKHEKLSLRAKAHFFRAMEGEPGVDLICLALVDARATRGGEDPELLALAINLLKHYYGSYSKKKARPLLNGREVMIEFGLPEGTLVGEILKKVSEGVQEGIVKNKKEALSYARAWLERSGLF